MSTALHNFITKHTGENRFPDLRVGWTVKIYQKISEGEKAKSQMFEGVIIARQHGDEPGATITVRKVTGGIGVEKILPLRLPSIEKIEVVKRPRVRRAKLYYLREKSSKEIRRKTKHAVSTPAEAPQEVASS
ncbi:MAG: 50S ribosomal protein L19 [Patescibacteria group bacterium]